MWESALFSCRMSKGREFPKIGAWQEKDVFVILRLEVMAGRSKVKTEETIRWHVDFDPLSSPLNWGCAEKNEPYLQCMLHIIMFL